jgi:hypothetical protein
MIWKPVKDYEHEYEIREDGKLRSIDRFYEANRNGKIFQYRIKGKELKPSLQDGYLSMELVKNGKSKKLQIHRLVYSTFIGNLQNGLVVHHKDHNKLNNHYSNLEQISQKEHNLLHKHDGPNKGGKTPKEYIDKIKKIKSEKIFPRCEEAYLLKEKGINYIEIAKILNIGPRQVYYLIARYKSIKNINMEKTA